MRTLSKEKVVGQSTGDRTDVLGRAFFETDSQTLARRLLGQRLVRCLPDGTRISGLVMETEAYLGPKDRASHAYGSRRTPGNEAMYARAGTAYVYFTYGMHYCFNVVCGAEGDPQAVLVRALQPVEGLEAMRRARGRRGHRTAHDRDLCSGPARLCEALAVDRSLNGHDLTAGESLWLEPGREVAPRRVRRACRIGVDYSGAWARRKLRWLVADSPDVSVRAERKAPGGRGRSARLSPSDAQT